MKKNPSQLSKDKSHLYNLEANCTRPRDYFFGGFLAAENQVLILLIDIQRFLVQELILRLTLDSILFKNK